jgi:stage 0 sporulation protein B (sporulation initiation phosphotransferase)
MGMRDDFFDARRLMEENLEVLRTYRHDLMNQVQLLQAYSQMKKYDRMQEPIRALVAEAKRHTEWSSFPSPMISYVVLSRDIRHSMLRLHATYEQVEVPTPEAESRAAKVLSDILDCIGEQSKFLLEPLSVDVWIVSFSQGYEIGWFLSGNENGETPKIDFRYLFARLGQEGIVLRQEETENGSEYSIRL